MTVSNNHANTILTQVSGIAAAQFMPWTSQFDSFNKRQHIWFQGFVVLQLHSW
jgi:hypothetical protein